MPEVKETNYSKPRLKYVDSLEPFDSITSHLLETGWQRKRIWFADYTMQTYDFKWVGIERKEIGDLFGSLGKRLEKQLADLVEHYEFSILLIEGSWSRVKENGILTPKGIEGWSWKAIWNFLRSWQDRGITLELTTSTRHTIQRLNELYAYYQKTAHKSGANRSKTGDDRLLAFPKGVGIKTAENILGKFGSLHNVAGASIKELVEVDGVGEKRAESIVVHFNKDGNV